MSQVQLSSLSPIAHKGVPCISTEMLAQAYEVESKQIRQNFTNNRERFVEGKHFFQLSGNDLKEFKNYVENFDLVQLDKRARHFTLWTERGAARHAKMLNSDKAWDVFELLEETFFRVAAERYAEQSKNIGQLTPAHRAELKGIVDAKLSTYPASVQGKARSEIWTRFNRHFRIAEYAQLPAERMAEARDYLIELEVKALKALPSAPSTPLAIENSRIPNAMEELRKLVTHCGMVRNIIHIECHPGGKSMRMTLDEREIYDTLYQLYCVADDSLLAAYRALDAGYKIGRQYGRG